jgi:DNA-binding beta-propeller fold protein YncE
LDPDGTRAYVIARDSTISAYSLSEGPLVTSVFPRAGGPGSLITVAGTGFSAVGSDTIHAGTHIYAPEPPYSTDRIVYRQLDATGDGVSVRTAGKVSNKAPFRAWNRPDPGNLRLTAAIFAGAPAPRRLALVPDGELLLALAPDTLLALGADPARPRFHRPVQALPTGIGDPGSMAATPDGRKVYLADVGADRVRVVPIDPLSASPLGLGNLVRDAGGEAAIEAVDLEVSPDGRWLLVAGSAGTILQVATASDSVVAVLSGGFSGPSRLAVHPDGRLFALLDSAVEGGLAVHEYAPALGNGYVMQASGVLSASAALPEDLVLTRDGSRLLATAQDGADHRRSVIPVWSLAESTSVILSAGNPPPLLALNHSGSLAFQTDPDSDSLRAITAGGTSIAAMPCQEDPTGIAVSLDDARLYLAYADSVAVVDLTSASAPAFVSGTGQMGTTGRPLDLPLEIRVTGGAPVEGAPVRFTASSGSFLDANDTETGSVFLTAADGKGAATARFKAGDVGPDTVRVRVGGLTASAPILVLEDSTMVPIRIVRMAPDSTLAAAASTTLLLQFNKAVVTSSLEFSRAMSLW